ncbi:hypothetical protein REPUB_Repub12eG0037400 [Reevesia pubescens]
MGSSPVPIHSQGHKFNQETQKPNASMSPKWLPAGLPVLLCLLIFASILTVTILSSNIIYPRLIFGTTSSTVGISQGQFVLPHSLQNQISGLQSQMGILLEQLHGASPESKALTKFADQLLYIAISFDKFVEALSGFYASSLAGTHEISNVDEDFSDPDISEVEERSTLHFNSGLPCPSMASNVDRFMSYRIYRTCPDDWDVAQKLMLSGCDPLPRRCFSNTPPRYGEIRIGLDFSPTTGTFAALMRERNVTIASFNEVITLRGLLPLYLSIGSRLPFFDNTLHIIHSTLFLDGWIGIELLQFVLFDWDRVHRPKGLLWVDRFFCKRDDLKIYLDEFSRLDYRKLLWRVVPKTDKLEDEFYFSAVLEKPPRS